MTRILRVAGALVVLVAVGAAAFLLLTRARPEEVINQVLEQRRKENSYVDAKEH